jgi:ParB family chromosome partitioning protein
VTTERRGGLGRGLGALFESSARPADDLQVEPDAGSAAPVVVVDERTVAGATLRALMPTEIRPNPRQPRTEFAEDALAELVISLREVGVLQPVVVRPLPAGESHGYELVMGERRWRAAQEAGLETLPAIVRDTPDDAMLRDALLENLHRQQLNPLEEAAAYQQLLEEFGVTHEQLATRIGRSRPQVSNTIRLLQLPPTVQRRVAAGVLSAGHARALLSLTDAAAQERLAARVVAENLSVRTVEEMVAIGDVEDGAIPAPSTRTPRPGDPDVEATAGILAGAMSDHLDTRVRVAVGRGKGKLTIEFADVDDLARIARAMGVTGE